MKNNILYRVLYKSTERGGKTKFLGEKISQGHPKQKFGMSQKSFRSEDIFSNRQNPPSPYGVKACKFQKHHNIFPETVSEEKEKDNAERKEKILQS